jgi:hypothetical protein
MEHRWGQRMPTDLPVRLIGTPGAIGTGCIRDVSVTGAFVQTNLRLPLLTRVQIEPLTPNASDARRLPAYVTRTDVNGIGVEWSDLTPAVVAELLCAASEPVPAAAMSG